MPLAGSMPVILASASLSRREMLTNAGVSFQSIPADVDETAVRQALGDIEPVDMAEVLARAKAEAVSSRHPDALVIGSDQILAFEDEVFEKPSDLDEARVNLLRFRGGMHELHSAVALAVDGTTDWCVTDTARLKMREFTPEFLGRYLASVGPEVCSSVGAYQLEGLGVQLFEDIEGNYFSILGMPLMPLLGELRRRKVIDT
jgi:septum formation protein